MTNKIKPGDWIKIINDNHCCPDVTVGDVYKVVNVEMHDDKFPVTVIDDVGDLDCPRVGSFELMTSLDSNTQLSNTYTAILESMLTDEQVGAAKRIMDSIEGMNG